MTPGLEGAVLWVFVGIVGACVGSFLNVVIGRLPIMMEREWARDLDYYLAEKKAQEAGVEFVPPEETEQGTYNLLKPASRCPKCQTPIKLRHNVPILGWLVLRGQCAACGQPISARYPFVELLGALAALGSVVAFGFTWQAVCASGLLFALIALTFIDADTTLLPDSITLPLLWAGLIVNMSGMFVPLPQAVVGAIFGYLSLWSVYWIFKLVTGKEGMGYGDFKLLAALGAWFGWMSLPAIILLSSVVGLIFAITQRVGFNKQMPFGPYLALAGVIALFYRGPINAIFFAG